MTIDLSCPASNRRTFLSTGAGIAVSAGLVGSGALSGCASAARTDREGELDELFADLADCRGDVAPIDSSEYESRRQRLGRLLAEQDRDALILEPCATMTYLSGVSWGRSERLFGLIVLADGSHFWVAPAFEEERARRRIVRSTGNDPSIVTWDEHEYAYAPLASELGRRRATRLCMEPSIRYAHVAALAAAMGQDPAASARALVTELRGRKDEHELALLRRANEATQEAILAASHHIRPGMVGTDISELIHHAQTKMGLRNIWDLSLVGPAAALPHGSTERIELQRGEVILIDTGGALHGYQSDNTRSWVFDGTPSEHQAGVWHAVHAAQRAAFDSMAPGVVTGDVDRAARGFLEAGGWTRGYSTFSHRLGHGIGLEGHEDPYFDGGSEVVLKSGMTLSNEPGIYLLGEFGIRIEDIIAITEDGAEHFGSWQKAPTSPA
ncbi:MAG: Xaa-Pro dipeptidase [Candidatus Paceibacteria bacterium]|jgi:Xaa-Pro dipeptidase